MITAKQARKAFRYDPATGLVWWKERGHGRQIHRPAGVSVGRGYKQVELNGVRYLTHRVIWLMVTGKWPKADIDHKDRDPSNNRWDNLREATRSQNNANMRSRGNVTGYKGVAAVRKSKKFRASIKPINSPRVVLGYFDTAFEAHLAYAAAAKKYFGEFANP